MLQSLSAGLIRGFWRCLLCIPFLLTGEAIAQRDVTKAVEDENGFDYTFVPDETVALLLAHPYQCADLDLVKFPLSMNDYRFDRESEEKRIAFLKRIKQVAYCELEHAPGGAIDYSNGFIVTTFFDAKGMSEALTERPISFPHKFLDDRSIVMGGTSEEELETFLEVSKGAPRVVTDDGWKKVQNKYFVCAGDQRHINRLLNDLPGSKSGLKALWEESRYGYLGIGVEKDSLVIRVAFEAGTKELVAPLQEGLEFAVDYATHSLPLAKELFRTEMQLPHLKFLFERLSAIPQGAKVQSEGGMVWATTSIPVEVPADILKRFRDHVYSLNIRKYSQSSLNKIADALIRYCDDHGHYPQAVVLGKDGKGGPPHSWRVEILSMIPGYEEVYNAYNFDKAWDSEDNKKLIEKIPFFYRHPADDPNSHFTSYFGITGPTTIFAEGMEVGIQDVDDGTDYTIAVVEAKRDVPWTKPEDIPFSPDKPLPKLGGWISDGWYAGMASGRARFIGKDFDVEVLKSMFQRSDGQVIFEEEDR